MLKYGLSALLIILGIGIFPSFAVADFIEGMDDVPLPEEMSQMTQDDISFGNEETRLLEAYLTPKRIDKKVNGHQMFKKISNFYQESLPQLGWIYQGNRGNDLLFYRDGETLEVVKENNSPLLVRITVKTKP
ncbi:MAG: hypothetical protein IJ099_06555 [Alphaproteobacteria bacterium]|nr:hypothetical protein [Alphaproteobacteria bacterium]